MDKENSKKGNILLVVAIAFLVVTVIGSTYALVTTRIRVTNNQYNTLTHCLFTEYGIGNGDNTQDLTGLLFPSASINKGLSGRVSLKISDECDLTGRATLYLHVNNTTSSKLTEVAESYCGLRRTGEKLNEYTTKEACEEDSNKRRWYNYGALYCENSNTLERMADYTSASECVTNGGLFASPSLRSPLKYAVYDNATATGTPLSVGEIYANDIGTDIPIYANFTVNNTLKYYYVFIWLDGYLTDNEYVDLMFDGYISASVVQTTSPVFVTERTIQYGYEFVNYIQSSGTQYIDTGIKPTATTDIEVSFLADNTNIGYQRIFGQSGASRYELYANGSTTTSWCFYIAGTGYTISIDQNGTFKTVKFKSKEGLYLNGALVQSTSLTEVNANNIWLFRGNDRYSNLKISSAKLWQDNVLVRDFVPCHRYSDDAVGLYDAVNNQFYSNAGTGTFTYG